MRKFNIKVNGKSYEVEVEEIGGGAVAMPAAPAQAPAAKTAPAAPAAPAASANVPEGAEKVTAPMPGTILKILVSTGQSVKKGEVLAILEAMKMENEIMAPRDGKIAAISVTEGASVNSGDVLVAIQ